MNHPQSHLYIGNRITGKNAAFCGTKNPLFYRRNKFTRNRSAFNLIFKCNSCAWSFLRFHFNDDMAVLAAAADCWK